MDSAKPLVNKNIKQILFVCLGNICRSPAAEGVMNKVLERHNAHGWVIDSAGTGDWHVGDLPDRRMREAGSRRGYNFTHRCRQIQASDFDNFDLIIGMDDNNVRTLRRLSPAAAAAGRIRHIGEWLDPDTKYSYVPDPYYGTRSDFDLVIDLLENVCENLYQQQKQL